MYCEVENADSRTIWILDCSCNCVYVCYVGKEKNLEGPPRIVRNGFPQQVECGEEQGKLPVFTFYIADFEKFLQVNMQHSYNFLKITMW